MTRSMADQHAKVLTLGPVRPPLTADGWLQFNQTRWGASSRRVRFSETDSGGPAAEAVYYLNAAGNIILSPLTPYLPVMFQPGTTSSQTRIDQQWAAVGHLLANDMREHGLRHVIPLPPYVPDVRPWQWARFVADVRYTYHVDLPYDESWKRTNVRRSITRSQRDEFSCERTDNVDHLCECLQHREERQGFSYGLGLSDLSMAQSLLGPDAFRTYVCYAPDGEPASGGIILHQPGGRALYWVFGTRSTYLQAGATQFVIRHILNDLNESGAVGLDFVGAMMPSVAAMKATWGATLVPYYGVDGGRVRALAKHAREYWQFRRNSNR